jgi:cytochrome b6
MSQPLGTEEKAEGKPTGMPFFPNFMLRDLLLWLLVLNLLAILAVFFPWELGQKADAFAPAPEGIKPEWYFMFMFQTLKYIPSKVAFIDGELLGIAAFSMAGILWMFIPFFDRKSSRGKRNRRLTYIGICAIAYIILMTTLGWLL